MLGLTGTATLTAIGGCIESPESGEGNDGEASNFMDAYVLVYHWGYTPFDENGNELDLIEIPTETELTLHASGPRPFTATAPLADCRASRYHHATGELVLEPAESLTIRHLRIPPQDALGVLRILKSPTTPAPVC